MSRMELSLMVSALFLLIALARYGVLALKAASCSKRGRHASTGRGRHAVRTHWVGAGHRLEGLNTPALVIVERLRTEREAGMSRAPKALLVP